MDDSHWLQAALRYFIERQRITSDLEIGQLSISGKMISALTYIREHPSLIEAPMTYLPLAYHRPTFKPVQWIGEGVYLKLNNLGIIYPRDNRATRENDRKSYKGNLREQ